MKMIKFFASCILVAAIVGCTSELSDPQLPDTDKTPVEIPVGEYELNASIGLMTKTALNDLALTWENDDVIKVWTGEVFTDYVHQGEGKFKGEKPAVLKGDKYVALYPAASVSGTAVTFTIPQEQAFAAKKANDLPMVAVWGEDEQCVFTPVCSILEMPLTVTDGVTLTAIDYAFNGKVGAGEYTYDWATGTYGTDNCGDITLTGTFASGNVYNAVVPGDYSDGFTLTLADNQNCAMVLTATNGAELSAGKVQPLGAVAYAQLAPKFTITYDDWAATATLVSTPGNGTRYWLSKTVNGEPLEGVAPVDMSSLAVGAAIKLYGYLCSENVAAAGVKDGDKLYFVSEYVAGSKKYMRSVEYTYHPDPLEIIVYADALNKNITGGLAGWNTSVTGDETRDANWTDDKYAGSACIKFVLDGPGEEFAIKMWDNVNDTDVDMSSQAAALYNIEFYVKADKEIKGNAYFTIRYYVGSTRVFNPEDKYVSAWQNYTAAPDETPIPANTWTKISIPMQEVWLKTKISETNYPAVADNLSDWQGYASYGRDGWLYSFKKIERFYIMQHSSYKNAAESSNPSTFLIDHFTIRKATL